MVLKVLRYLPTEILSHNSDDLTVSLMLIISLIILHKSRSLQLLRLIWLTSLTLALKLLLGLLVLKEIKNEL